jgi:drug/metabolite transporter (DMT)-like permease
VGLGLFTIVLGHPMLPRGDQWPPLLGMSVATAGAFLCLLTGLPRLRAIWTSILGTVEAVAVPLLAWLMLSEPLGASTAAGGALVVVGAALASVALRRPMPPET